MNLIVNSDSNNIKVEPMGLDAKVSKEDHARDLVILVLGETARSDRFSINGYNKKTNPLLEKEDVISFKKFYSCGTSTAESLPCMFSNLGHDNYKRSEALAKENILDVLTHSGDIKILWRDNNSDSKGVATRIEYEDFRLSSNNTICDEECRDIGMLNGLQSFVDTTKTKDILIVLHQMGSHGPAYYKRVPKPFDKFKPGCMTNELKNCSLEQINNSYDNTILYTDYFLSEVIKFLKHNSTKFETAMFYVSDHGESLGENGLYLHSLPYFIAPIEQKNVPAIFWISPKLKKEINFSNLKYKSHNTYNHDYIFNTLLGFFEVKTKLYNPKLDLLK